MSADHDHADPAGAEAAGLHEDSSTRRIIGKVNALAALPLIGLLRFYQLVISPLTPPTCRYYPSCSAYAVTALRRFGPIKGTWLASRRVLRCHPWAPGGVDHVPLRAQPASGGGSTPAGTEASTDAGTDPSPRVSSDFRSFERLTDPRDKGLS